MIDQQAEQDHAMQYALRVLGYRARSEAEMRQKLQRKGFSPLVTDRTLAALMRLGLLDDREFSRGWVDARTGYGQIRLRQELRQKGVDHDVAEETIAMARTAEDEFVSARRIAMRAVRTQTPPLDRATMLRLRRLLIRRGFPAEIVYRVCATLNDHLSAEGDWLE